MSPAAGTPARPTWDDLKPLAGRALVYVTGDALNKGLAFLLAFIYARYLTPADYGLWASLSTLAAVLSILCLEPIEGGALRLYFDARDEAQQRMVYATAWLGVLGWGIGVLVVSEWVGPWLFTGLFGALPYQLYGRPLVWAVVLTNSAILLLRSWLMAHERAGRYAALNTAHFLLSIGFVIYFVGFQHAGVLGNVQAVLISTLIVALPAAVYLGLVLRLRISIARFKTLMGFTLPLLPHLLSLWALNLSDRLILARYLSLREVGIYSLGYQIGQILSLVAISSSNALTPYYYRVADQPGGPEKLARLALYYLSALAWLGIGLASLGPEFIVLIAAPEYWAAQTVAPWIVLAFFIRSFYLVFTLALYYCKRPASLPVITMALAIINVAVNLWLVPWGGYPVAMFNTVAVFTLQAVVVGVVARRLFALPYPVRRLVKLIAILFAVYGVSLLVHFPSVWLTLLLKGGVILSAPLWLYALGFFEADELAALREGTRRGWMLGR